jgi:hypothetical protein
LKYFFYIFIPLLVSFTICAGQSKMPLQGDPNRQKTPDIANTVGSRMAGTSALTAAPKVKDTLNLPFFEDFTSQAAHLAFVVNDTLNIVQFVTHGLHGLYNGDKIFISGDTSVSKFLHGRRYIRRISPFKFELYKNAALTDSLKGNGTNILITQNPIWVRENDVASPNPDTLKWMNTGGVYINNRYCMNPPSYNVATFDGLNAYGKAYHTTNAYETGGTDTLTSLPIDLSKVTASTPTLILSFYWQRGGLGEIPDVADSLYLQFKNNLGVWKYIWGMKGNATGMTSFSQYMDTIKNPAYFYKGFQFRFISQGERGGSYDVWNLDYIHLDTNRTISQTFHDDVAIQKAPISILKNFTAMPFKQFFANKNNELSDTLSVTMNSLDAINEAIDDTLKRSYLSNEINHSFISKIDYNFGNAPNVNAGTQRKIYFKYNKAAITNDSTNLKLKYFLFFSLTNKIEFGVHYKTNDSISGYTMLDNYYAYDDSTAEWGWWINQEAGKVAVKFPVNVVDTLVAIDIFFPHIKQDYTGEALDLIAWSSLHPEQEIPQSRTPVALSYAGSNNQFKRFDLTTPVQVKDSVFVGYQQGSDNKLQIGFDVNTNSYGKMFYNVNNSWGTVQDSGTLMIRPVFKNHSKLVTGILKPDPSPVALDCEVYPNPTTGILNIIGTIKNATLTDLSGRIIMEQTFSPALLDKKMELQNIPAGFYLLRLSNEEAYAVKKIVLVK